MVSGCQFQLKGQNFIKKWLMPGLGQETYKLGLSQKSKGNIRSVQPGGEKLRNHLGQAPTYRDQLS